jgi:hypothetical protein
MPLFAAYAVEQSNLRIARYLHNGTLDGFNTLAERVQSGASLTVFHGRLFLAFDEFSDSLEKNVWVMSSTDGFNFGNKVLIDNGASGTPFIFVDEGMLCVSFRVANGFRVRYSDDGQDFSRLQTILAFCGPYVSMARFEPAEAKE